MKYLDLVVLFVLITLSATPSLAAQLPKDAIAVTEAELVALFPGQKFDGKAYREDGRPLGDFTIEFKTDNTFEYQIGKGGNKAFELKGAWSIKNGKFCRTFPAPENYRCGTRGLLFHKDNVCYQVWPNSSVIAVQYTCTIK